MFNWPIMSHNFELVADKNEISAEELRWMDVVFTARARNTFNIRDDGQDSPQYDPQGAGGQQYDPSEPNVGDRSPSPGWSRQEVRSRSRIRSPLNHEADRRSREKKRDRHRESSVVVERRHVSSTGHDRRREPANLRKLSKT